MRTYDEQLARTNRQPRPAADRRDGRAAEPARPNEPPTVQALDESAILDLQRFAGNTAVAGLLSTQRPTGRKEEVGAPQPRFDLGAFAPERPSQAFAGMPDKSETEVETEEQDQSIDVGTFARGAAASGSSARSAAASAHRTSRTD